MRRYRFDKVIGIGMERRDLTHADIDQLFSYPFLVNASMGGTSPRRGTASGTS